MFIIAEPPEADDQLPNRHLIAFSNSVPFILLSARLTRRWLVDVITCLQFGWPEYWLYLQSRNASTKAVPFPIGQTFQFHLYPKMHFQLMGLADAHVTERLLRRCWRCTPKRYSESAIANPNFLGLQSRREVGVGPL